MPFNRFFSAFFFSSALLLTLSAPAAMAQSKPIGFNVPLGDGPFTYDTAEQHGIKVSVVARGMDHPYSLTFLPDDVILVTEHTGKLRAIRNGKLDPEPVEGVPKARAFRSGGLLDIEADPNYAQNGYLYLTYTKPNPDVDGESAVALIRAKFDGKALTDVTELWRGAWSPNASGSRIAFGLDGKIYLTTGAPFDDSSQDLSSPYGKVLRLNQDGSIPADNPFVGQEGALGEIYSLGHRDQLGLTVHPVTGAVLAAEHGPNGGDEVNLILPGKNYGWPVATFGRAYDGSRQTDKPWEEGIELPIVLWIPSIAPSGLIIYNGDKFPAWKGNLFAGSSREGEIDGTGHLERVVFNDDLGELRRESLLTGLHQRIRDVDVSPDGYIYAVTDMADGALLKIEPAE